MEKNSKQPHPDSREPHTWTARDTYQAYAASILKSDPQCWGKYNRGAKRKNYWIYKTVGTGTATRIVEVMSYPRWVKIIKAYFDSAKQHIIFDGTVLSLGNLGRIGAKRCERNFDKPKVNQFLTRQQPKVFNEEKQRMVPAVTIFFTDADFIRIGWWKNHVLTNESVYAFYPAKGNANRHAESFTQAFSQANIQDPTLKFKYAYIPRHRIRKGAEEQIEENGSPVV